MSKTDEKAKSTDTRKSPVHTYPAWSPRFWHGMLFGDWLRLLARNRFRIHPVRWGLACTVTGCTVLNSALRIRQQLFYGRKIPKTEIEDPPIFIIGHWRSGTTYLHELMVRDDRFGYPTTYECFAPRHFLTSSWSIPRLVGFLLPRTRPMDNMSAGFDLPQEDEFALANMGCPTPYWRLAFPNEPPCYMELLDMEGVSDEVLSRWKRDLIWFIRALTLRKKKPLILKSPPHTGRIKILSELFPGSRFVHMTRNPDTLFASTRRLWPSLEVAQGLQVPRSEYLDEYIFDCFERMYRGFEKQRGAIDPDRICDVRYEDLVRDPIGQLEAIYEKLGLGDFESIRPKIEAHVSSKKDYKPNRHTELEPEIKAELQRRWAGYYEKYGYTEEPPCRE